jgi:predicted  nucleic acid-binding Zn-ribbon protein
MNGDLELLLKLQNIDYDLGEMERSKEYIPDMMENLRMEIADCESKMKTASDALSQAYLEQKDIELQLQDKQEKLRLLQGKMMAIKTNKEYDALVSEIDQLKQAIASFETRDVELLELSESRQKEIEALSKQLEEVKGTNVTQLTSLQQQIDTVGSKILAMEKLRVDLAAQVSQRAMAVYERVRKGKGGAVVIAVKKRACGACYKALPPQKIQEIRLGEKLIMCDSCGRMLFWMDESEN